MKYLFAAIVLCFMSAAQADGLYLTTSEGIAVKDGSGDCVTCDSGSPVKECEPVFNTVNGATFQPDAATPASDSDMAPSTNYVKGVNDGYTAGLSDCPTIATEPPKTAVRTIVRTVHDAPNWTIVPAQPARSILPLGNNQTCPVPIVCKQEISRMDLFVIALIFFVVGIAVGRVSKQDK